MFRLSLLRHRTKNGKQAALKTAGKRAHRLWNKTSARSKTDDRSFGHREQPVGANKVLSTHVFFLFTQNVS
jgi:hypothetical protein